MGVRGKVGKGCLGLHRGVQESSMRNQAATSWPSQGEQELARCERLWFRRGSGLRHVWTDRKGNTSQHSNERTLPLCVSTRSQDFGRRNTAAQGRKGHLVGEARQTGEDQEGSQMLQRLCFILPMVGSW